MERVYPEITRPFLCHLSESQPDKGRSRAPRLSATPSIKPIKVLLNPKVVEKNKGRKGYRSSVEKSVKKLVIPKKKTFLKGEFFFTPKNQ